MNTKHFVFLSGGKDSTALALRLKELHPETDYRYIYTPTGDELPEMVAHWDYLGFVLGRPIEYIKREGGLKKLIDDNNALPSFRLRFCTRELKIMQAKAFFIRESRDARIISYVGLRADEEEREGGIFGDIVEQTYPLREWGWGIDEVVGYLKEQGVTIPKRTDCARCPFQRIQDWYLLWKIHPDLYQDAELQESQFGHTFRSPHRDTWPAPLSELRQEFENGRKIRGMKLDTIDDEGGACRVCRL